MNKLLMTAGLLAVAIISPTMAADLQVETSDIVLPDLPSDEWTGFYAGLFGGYVSGNAETMVGVIPDDIIFSGGLVGAAVGFNYQLDDNFVLGLEGDIAWSNAEGSAVCADNVMFACAGNLEWLSTVRARAGVTFDNALLYATAGVAVAGATATVIPPPLNASGEFSDTYVGWTAGFGGEVQLTDNISARLEYAYTDLGTRTAPQGTLTTTGDTEISPYLHSVKAGLNFAF